MPARGAPVFSTRVPARGAPVLNQRVPARGAPVLSQRVPARGAPVLSHVASDQKYYLWSDPRSARFAMPVYRGGTYHLDFADQAYRRNFASVCFSPLNGD